MLRLSHILLLGGSLINDRHVAGQHGRLSAKSNEGLDAAGSLIRRYGQLRSSTYRRQYKRSLRAASSGSKALLTSTTTARLPLHNLASCSSPISR